MDQPTIKVRIAAHVIREEQEGRLEDPLLEVSSVETVVNSTPAIHAAVREFAKYNRSQGVAIGTITVAQVR